MSRGESKTRLGEYYYLTKPGIVRGNAFALVSGFLLASSLYGFHLWVFAAALIGTSLVISSACVFNNYLDRSIDEQMERTQKRALVQGRISPRAALIYGTILVVVGAVILWVFVSPLVMLLGLVGHVWYVAIYGFAKRTTPWSTLIGSVCGAIPPAAGYAAVSGSLDMAALLLFVIMTVWQMPHFYAIAIRREDEYRAGGVPVLAVAKGARITKQRILMWIVVYCLVSPLLTIFGYTGFIYLILTVALSVYWLTIALRTWNEVNVKRWAGRLFGVSLLVLMLQSVLIAVGHLLP